MELLKAVLNELLKDAKTELRKINKKSILEALTGILIHLAFLIPFILLAWLLFWMIFKHPKLLFSVVVYFCTGVMIVITIMLFLPQKSCPSYRGTSDYFFNPEPPPNSDLKEEWDYDSDGQLIAHRRYYKSRDTGEEMDI